jgi:thiosulfate dehydrogenase (quinone) large subunit
VPRARPRRPAPRALPLGAPPRAWLLSGWALLPLRAFLSFAFLFAGLQKLANPAFFNAASPSSLHAQMLGSIRYSPIKVVLEHLLQHSTLVGVVIALGEVAVGIGMALGLWTRIAAIGGMLLALSLFLAVSWNDSPWYTGPDVVYLFAFVPFLLAGNGGVLSVDAWVARRAAREHELDDPEMVVVPFAEVQRVCGFYKAPTCTAIKNRLCAPAGCPYLEGARTSLPAGRQPDEVDRRAVVIGGIAAATAAAAGLVVAGGAAGAGRLLGGSGGPSGSQATLPSTTQGTGAGGANGTAIGPAVDVPVGQSATFTVPDGTGAPGLVIQPAKGQFVAYNAICPHEGCTVGYFASANVIACPCHGSEFQVSNGAAISGPAFPRGLTALTVTDSGGQLYVK